MFLGNFLNRIASDFKQKELVPLKLLFFVHSSTLFVLYPYLTIHMRELGISVEEAAVMSAVTPLVAIVMPPMAGLVADRIGNFKMILSALSALGGGAALLLLLVPSGRVTVHFPQQTVLQLSCQSGKLLLDLAGEEPCVQVDNGTNSLDMRLETCGVTCFVPHVLLHPYADLGRAEQRTSDIMTSSNFSFQLREGNHTEIHNYKLKGNSVATKISALTNSSIFFPMPGLYSFSCQHSSNETNSHCSIIKNNEVDSTIPEKPTKFHIIAQRNNDHQYRISKIEDRTDKANLKNVFCSHNEHKLSGETHALSVPLSDELVDMKACLVRCLATTKRTNICSNKKVIKDLDTSLTFWMYLAIRVLVGMISGTSFAMFEGATIAILREHKADYGLQRMYATIGGMISSPLSGWLIDYASLRAGYTDFRPAFYLYAALKLVSAVLMLKINLEFKAPATNIISDVLEVLKKTEIVALLATCFILGTAWGYIESFLFWLLQDLGASRSLMGITITVGGIAGLPLLVMSGPIIDKIGHANVLFIGFIFYAIRLMGYSLIYDPWMCLIFEAMESVTSSLAFTAAVTYGAKLSTMSTDSSIQGLIGGIYYGVGRGAGSLAGGYLMKAVGTRPTYQIFSAVTLITGIVYFLFNKFYVVRKSTEEDCEKEKKNIEEIEKKKPDDNPTSLEIIPTEKPLDSEKNKKTLNENENLKIEINGGSKINKAFESDENETKVTKDAATQSS